MAKQVVKFKVAGFLVRGTITCKECDDFNGGKCPVMSYLLNNEDIVVYGSRAAHPTFVADVDDVLVAWRARRQCGKIAANCCRGKMK